IVVMFTAPGFVAGYPLGFTNTTAAPSWFIPGNATTKVTTPISVAADKSNNFIFVGNSNNTISVFNRTQLSAGANSTATPAYTIAAAASPIGMAVDPGNHILYVSNSTTAAIDRY